MTVETCKSFLYITAWCRVENCWSCTFFTSYLLTFLSPPPLFLLHYKFYTFYRVFCALESGGNCLGISKHFSSKKNSQKEFHTISLTKCIFFFLKFKSWTPRHPLQKTALYSTLFHPQIPSLINQALFSSSHNVTQFFLSTTFAFFVRFSLLGSLTFTYIIKPSRSW